MPTLRYFLLALLAQLCLLFPLPPLLQTIAALLLTGLLPGWLLVQWLIGRSSAPPDRAEQWLYAIGAGYSLMLIVTLLLSYLPGGLTRGQTLVGFDGLVLGLLILNWWSAPGGHPQGARGEPTSSTSATRHPPPAGAHWARHLLLISLLTLLLVAGFFRLTNLGFAEFHGDEARAILRAAAVVQGYEEVLFLHRKGPTEILLPALLFSLTGQINELTARLPFALAGLATLLAVFALGWRLLGPLAGWVAAFLLAFDGYFIAFARFVQYQSVVLLLSTLAVLIAWRLVRNPQAMTRYWLLLAIFLAAGLLSHYDLLAVGVALAFLLLLLWQQSQTAGALLRATGVAILLGAGLAALFYVPFALHPRFQATSAYLVEERLVAGRAFPYNNLADIFQRGVLYSSAPLVLLFVILATLALCAAYRRGLPAGMANLGGGLAIALVALLYWQPQWLVWQGIDLAVIPATLLLAAAWLAPRLSQEQRLLWLWFGVLFVIACFGIANARTHVYIFFVPWALLIGDVVAQGWQALARRGGQTLAVTAAGLAIVIGSGLLGQFAYSKFVDSTNDTLRTAINSPTPIGSLYGFPFANGWKVVGALYAQGVLQGDYETNERYDWAPSWYTHGQQRCGSTATWYFAVDRLEPWIPDRREIEDALEEQGYRPWGLVEVAGAERMVIYRQTGGAAIAAVQRFRQEEYVAAFDQQARADLPLTYPAVEATDIAHPLHVNFADQIWLQGYDLRYQAPLKAGDTFQLTLYWEAQRAIERSYTVFTQAYYGNGVMVAQKDSTPVCARAPTNGWTPGTLISDVYEVPIAADVPPGVYPLYVGLYDAENFARLPVFDAAGRAVDQQVQLTDLPIETIP